MTAGCTLRRGVAGDAPCIGVLAMQVFLDTYATEGVRPDLAREVLAGCAPAVFHERLLDRERSFVLAERDAHLVGFAELARARRCPIGDAGGDLELVRLYVQRRFQRRRIGAALLRQAETIALDEGREAMWLAAWSGNQPALAFYRAQGWIDRGEADYRFEDRSYLDRVFVRDLRPGTS